MRILGFIRQLSDVFILAELIFEAQISFMLEKIVSRPPGSALLSINDTSAHKINSAGMKASM